VGDGLVSQIPALLLSVSTGLIVTRSSDSEDMGTMVSRQLGGHSRALKIAGGAALLLSQVPGLPNLPFLLVGGGVLVIASRAKSAETQAAKEEAEAGADVPADEAEADLMAELTVDPLALTLAPDLVPLVDGASGDLLDRVKALRRALAGELGIVLPPVRTRDSVLLPQSTYAISINGVEVGQGQAPPGMALAIGPGLDGLPGEEANEPVFGLTGKWLPEEFRAHAELLGATVVDRSSLIITHLSELVRQHGSRLLGREEVAAATRALRRTHPTVVEDLTPALLSLGEIQRVLHGLLDEKVSIRDLVRIYEALSVAAKGGTDPDRLLEAVRAALAPAIVASHAREGRIDVLTIEPRLQQALLESVRPSEGGLQLAVEPGLAEMLISQLSERFTRESAQGAQPLLVCAGQIRMPLRRLLRLALPALPVLSYSELSVGTATVNALGMIDDVRNLVP
jgi:flagellar biosynthesis protein FlhA